MNATFLLFFHVNILWYELKSTLNRIIRDKKNISFFFLIERTFLLLTTDYNYLKCPNKKIHTAFYFCDEKQRQGFSIRQAVSIAE